MTTTITVTTQRQVVLPKAMCERKNIRPGTSLRISEVGDGFYVTPVPEPTAAELATVFKALDEGRRTRPITAEDEAHLQEEIKQYRTLAAIRPLFTEDHGRNTGTPPGAMPPASSTGAVQKKFAGKKLEKSLADGSL